MILVLMLDLTLIFVQNLSPLGSLHEATEGADFPKVDHDPVRVAKNKLAYNLDLLTGIPIVCMNCACHVPFGSYA